MNYYDAREIQGPGGTGTGLYHYTCMNDGRVWPVGYCTKEHGCSGHPTPDEARLHYKQYLLDKVKFHAKVREWPKDKCQVDGCDAEATVLADVDAGRYYEFCKAHATREMLEKLISVGSSASSW